MSKPKDLELALIQSHIHWEEKEKNLDMFEQKILSINKKVNLIILPETFNTGFCMKKAEIYAETMEGTTVKWLQKMALEKDAVITGSCMISEENYYYNRLLWVSPSGGVAYYDKRHLFRLAYEQNYFSAGKERKIVQLNGWNLCLNVCYDLRFPVWCRNRNDYDVLLFVANWPQVRIKHWRTLLQVRAIENMSYVLGLNRIGTDGTGKFHDGYSAVVHADGHKILESENEEILMATLSYDELQSYRNRFQFFKDSDDFAINIKN